MADRRGAAGVPRRERYAARRRRLASGFAVQPFPREIECLNTRLASPASSIDRRCMGRVVAIVQARMGSTRLPGKMLQDLCGYPLLEWALRRTRRSRRLDAVVLATSRAEQDDPLVALAGALGIPCHRGSETDVLERYVDAAQALDADVVVRLCADNPLVAPEELDRLIDFYQACVTNGASPGRLYVCNGTPFAGNGYPDGLGGEIFSTVILRHLHRVARDRAHREHVNGYLLAHPQRFDIRTPTAPPEISFPSVKLDVDTPVDLDRMRTLCRTLSFDSSASEIVRAYRSLFRHSSL